MSRIETSNLRLGMWTDGENPGAGTQNQAAIGTGLNDNWKIVDNAIGAAHNADGSHKSAVIDAVHLKATVADGATLVQDTGTKKLKIPDGGVGSAQIATSAVTSAKIASGAVGSAHLGAAAVTSAAIATGAIGLAQLADGGVATAKLADAAVTLAKLDSATRLITGFSLYASATEAGAAAGQTAAAGTEWAETATYDVIKVRCMFYKQSNLKTLRLFGKARTSDPSQAWTVMLLAADYGGSVVASANAAGTNTAYNSYAEATIALDISALSNGTMYEVYVKLRIAGGGATANLKQLQLCVTG